MVKKIGNIRIIMGCIMIFSLMLTATFVFAKDNELPIRKSYYIEKIADNNYEEKELALVNNLNKTVIGEYDGKSYDLQIVDGNVILKDIATDLTRTIYDLGDAKYLSEVNLYYYNASYILIVTEKGELYANIYKSNDENIEFRKINLKNKIHSLKVIERKIAFYDDPSVELYGLNEDGHWEIIKL